MYSLNFAFWPDEFTLLPEITKKQKTEMDKIYDCFHILKESQAAKDSDLWASGSKQGELSQCLVCSPERALLLQLKEVTVGRNASDLRMWGDKGS